MVKNEQPPPFSTRFLASDGIPTYNALLDGHLGKRREFLLGNKKSLALLKQTGVISRVEVNETNPNQYVVVMHDEKTNKNQSIHERKRLPPRTPASNSHTASAPLLSTSKTRSPPSKTSANAALSSIHEDNQSHTSSLSTDTRLSVLKSVAKSQSTTALLRKAPHHPLATQEANDATMASSRRASTAAIATGSAIDQLKSLQSPHCTAATKRAFGAFSSTNLTPQSSSKPSKGTVEHLLDADATYQLKIRVLKEELSILEQEKWVLETEISKLRKQINGVNAVHENDRAVAHCSSIMQHRISKAEEEYMKLVTAQQQIKAEVDTIRRELVTLRKVEKKLQEEIANVQQVNATIEEKIRSSRQLRHLLTEELTELERRAHYDMIERRMKLPQEEDIVVDAEKLMRAVHERNLHREQQQQQQLLEQVQDQQDDDRLVRTGSKKKKHGSDTKPALSFKSAFQVIQQTLGLDSTATNPSIQTFLQSFVETENELLSKHKVNVNLQEDVLSLQKQHQALLQENAERIASIRGNYQASLHAKQELQSKMHLAMSKTESYNALRELRNQEHNRLRTLMQRCLEILQAEKLLKQHHHHHMETPASPSNSSHSASHSRMRGGGSGALLMSELPSPLMLEALQKRMTEVAIAIKLKHGASMVKENAQATRNASPGRTTRRMDMFSPFHHHQHHKEASKIVMGPREPSGTALSAIMVTAQPPTIEAAMAMTEHVLTSSNSSSELLKNLNPDALKQSPVQLSLGIAMASRGRSPSPPRARNHGASPPRGGHSTSETAATTAAAAVPLHPTDSGLLVPRKKSSVSMKTVRIMVDPEENVPAPSSSPSRQLQDPDEREAVVVVEKPDDLVLDHVDQ